MAIELYLSVVIPIHGDESVKRVQVSIVAFREHCRRKRILCELVFVETGEPRLTKELDLPVFPGPCAVRVIELPEDSDAKNVGIRRARGRFVLATELDNLLSREFLTFVGEHHWRYGYGMRDIVVPDGSIGLDPGWFPREWARSKPFRWFKNDAQIHIYPYSDAQRVLAIDIEPRPGRKTCTPVLEVFDAENSKIFSAELPRRRVVNIPLSNRNGQCLRLSVTDESRRWSIDRRRFNARVLRCGLYAAPMTGLPWSIPARIVWALTRSMGTSLLPQLEWTERWPDAAHLKACGDVMMLTREQWFEIHGYPESGSVDAVREASEKRRLGDAVVLNGDDWGLGTKALKETTLIESVPPDRRTAVDFAAIPVFLLLRVIPRPEARAFDRVGPAGDVSPPLRNPPKISIVTPSYQQGRYLEWTMRSVLEQGYPNLEYVVMDGGSKDETGEILARYQDRLAYWESAPDRGQADAVVRGFAHTTGEIMAYLNSDDVLAPGALDFVARYFDAHPEVDAIYSHRIFIDENNIVTRYWILPPHHSWMMQRWDYIPQETCFWRRRIYEKVGGIDPSFEFALDYDLFVRFMQQGRMERVNRFLGAFREHLSSKTVLQEGAHPEVGRVYVERGIRMADWQRLPQLVQFELLDVRSSWFAARGKVLPGGLAGVGYDYDLVWHGRLNGRHNSSGSSSDTRPI